MQRLSRTCTQRKRSGDDMPLTNKQLDDILADFERNKFGATLGAGGVTPAQLRPSTPTDEEEPQPQPQPAQPQPEQPQPQPQPAQPTQGQPAVPTTPGFGMSALTTAPGGNIVKKPPDKLGVADLKNPLNWPIIRSPIKNLLAMGKVGFVAQDVVSSVGISTFRGVADLVRAATTDEEWDAKEAGVKWWDNVSTRQQVGDLFAAPLGHHGEDDPWLQRQARSAGNIAITVGLTLVSDPTSYIGVGVIGKGGSIAARKTFAMAAALDTFGGGTSQVTKTSVKLAIHNATKKGVGSNVSASGGRLKELLAKFDSIAVKIDEGELTAEAGEELADRLGHQIARRTRQLHVDSIIQSEKALSKAAIGRNIAFMRETTDSETFMIFAEALGSKSKAGIGIRLNPFGEQTVYQLSSHETAQAIFGPASRGFYKVWHATGKTGKSVNPFVMARNRFGNDFTRKTQQVLRDPNRSATDKLAWLRLDGTQQRIMREVATAKEGKLLDAAKIFSSVSKRLGDASIASALTDLAAATPGIRLSAAYEKKQAQNLAARQAMRRVVETPDINDLTLKEREVYDADMELLENLGLVEQTDEIVKLLAQIRSELEAAGVEVGYQGKGFFPVRETEETLKKARSSDGTLDIETLTDGDEGNLSETFAGVEVSYVRQSIDKGLIKVNDDGSLTLKKPGEFEWSKWWQNINSIGSNVFGAEDWSKRYEDDPIEVLNTYIHQSYATIQKHRGVDAVMASGLAVEAKAYKEYQVIKQFLDDGMLPEDEDKQIRAILQTMEDNQNMAPEAFVALAARALPYTDETLTVDDVVKHMEAANNERIEGLLRAKQLAANLMQDGTEADIELGKSLRDYADLQNVVPNSRLRELAKDAIEEGNLLSDENVKRRLAEAAATEEQIIAKEKERSDALEKVLTERKTKLTQYRESIKQADGMYSEFQQVADSIDKLTGTRDRLKGMALRSTQQEQRIANIEEQIAREETRLTAGLLASTSYVIRKGQSYVEHNNMLKSLQSAAEEQDWDTVDQILKAGMEPPTQVSREMDNPGSMIAEMVRGGFRKEAGILADVLPGRAVADSLAIHETQGVRAGVREAGDALTAWHDHRSDRFVHSEWVDEAAPQADGATAVANVKTEAFTAEDFMGFLDSHAARSGHFKTWTMSSKRRAAPGADMLKANRGGEDVPIDSFARDSVNSIQVGSGEAYGVNIKGSTLKMRWRNKDDASSRMAINAWFETWMPLLELGGNKPYVNIRGRIGSMNREGTDVELGINIIVKDKLIAEKLAADWDAKDIFDYRANTALDTDGQDAFSFTPVSKSASVDSPAVPDEIKNVQDWVTPIEKFQGHTEMFDEYDSGTSGISEDLMDEVSESWRSDPDLSPHVIDPDEDAAPDSPERAVYDSLVQGWFNISAYLRGEEGFERHGTRRTRSARQRFWPAFDKAFKKRTDGRHISVARRGAVAELGADTMQDVLNLKPGDSLPDSEIPLFFTAVPSTIGAGFAAGEDRFAVAFRYVMSPEVRFMLPSTAPSGNPEGATQRGLRRTYMGVEENWVVDHKQDGAPLVLDGLRHVIKLEPKHKDYPPPAPARILDPPIPEGDFTDAQVGFDATSVERLEAFAKSTPDETVLIKRNEPLSAKRAKLLGSQALPTGGVADVIDGSGKYITQQSKGQIAFRGTLKGQKSVNGLGYVLEATLDANQREIPAVGVNSAGWRQLVSMPLMSSDGKKLDRYFYWDALPPSVQSDLTQNPGRQLNADQTLAVEKSMFEFASSDAIDGDLISIEGKFFVREGSGSVSIGKTLNEVRKKLWSVREAEIRGTAPSGGAPTQSHAQSLRAAIADADAKGVLSEDKAVPLNERSVADWDEQTATRYGLPDKAAIDKAVDEGAEVKYSVRTPRLIKATTEFYEAADAGGGVLQTIPEAKASEWGKLALFNPDFRRGINRMLRGQTPESGWENRTDWMYQRRPGYKTPEGKTLDDLLVADTIERTSGVVKVSDSTFVGQTTMSVSDIPLPRGWTLDNLPLGVRWDDPGVTSIRPKKGAGAAPQEGEVLVDVVSAYDAEQPYNKTKLMMNPTVLNRELRDEASEAEYLLMPSPSTRWTVNSVTKEGDGYRMVVSVANSDAKVKRRQLQDGAEALAVLNSHKNDIYDRIVEARAGSRLAVDPVSRDMWEAQHKELLEYAKNLGGVDRLMPVPPSIQKHLEKTYPVLRPPRGQTAAAPRSGAVAPAAAGQAVQSLLSDARAGTYSDSFLRGHDAWIEGHGSNSTPASSLNKDWSAEEADTAYSSMTESMDKLIAESEPSKARTVTVASKSLGLSNTDWRRVRPGDEAAWTKQGFILGSSEPASKTARAGASVQVLVDDGTQVYEAPAQAVDLGRLLNDKALRDITPADLRDFNKDVLARHGIDTESKAKRLFSEVEAGLKDKISESGDTLDDAVTQSLSHFFQAGEIAATLTQPSYVLLPRGGKIVPLGYSTPARAGASAVDVPVARFIPDPVARPAAEVRRTNVGDPARSGPNPGAWDAPASFSVGRLASSVPRFIADRPDFSKVAPKATKELTPALEGVASVVQAEHDALTIEAGAMAKRWSPKLSEGQAMENQARARVLRLPDYLRLSEEMGSLVDTGEPVAATFIKSFKELDRKLDDIGKVIANAQGDPKTLVWAMEAQEDYRVMRELIKERERIKGIGEPELEAVLQIEADFVSKRADLTKLTNRAAYNEEWQKNARQVTVKMFKNYLSNKEALDRWSQIVGLEMREFGNTMTPSDVVEVYEAQKRIRAPGAWKWFDKLGAVWRMLATAKPGFHVRNQIGGLFNNMQAGVTPAEQNAAYVATAKMARKARKNRKVTEADKLMAEGVRRGLIGLNAKVEDLPLHGKLTAVQHSLSAVGEMALRGGIILHYWKRLSKTSLREDDKWAVVGDALAKWHFDYADQGNFDRRFKRVVPFWVWMSRNAFLQAELMVSQSEHIRYSRRLMEEAGKREGDDEYNPYIPEYYEDNFYQQITTNKYLALDLPFMQLGSIWDFTARPPAVLSGLNPLIRQPIEVFVTDRDFYRGYELEGLSDQIWRTAEALIPPLKQVKDWTTGDFKASSLYSFVGVPIREIDPETQVNIMKYDERFKTESKARPRTKEEEHAQFVKEYAQVQRNIKSGDYKRKSSSKVGTTSRPISTIR